MQNMNNLVFFTLFPPFSTLPPAVGEAINHMK